MKRLLIAFTTLLVFAFAFSGMAQASLNAHYTEMYTISGEKGGITSVTYADGTTKSGKYLSDPTKWTGGKIYHFEHIDTNLRQQKSDSQLGLDARKLYTDNYYHASYFDLYNTKGASNNMLKSGTAEMSFNLKDKSGTNSFGTSMDFFLYEDNGGGYWLIFTELAWSLGQITDVNGATYELYLELKNTPTFEEAGYTNMKLHSEYKDMLSYFNFTDNQNMFGFYVPDGEERHIAFTLRGYGDQVNPHHTPIPGAVWLMGSGVAGLLALRRRNSK